MKTCTKCGETKPHTDFHKRKASPDGLKTRCKECSAEHKAEHNARPDVKARMAEYASANPHVAWKAGAVARAKQYGFDITVEDFTKADVINTYGNKCWHCGGPFEELDHHPVPCARGGHHVIENVKPSCITCNRKGAGARRANKPATERKTNE